MKNTIKFLGIIVLVTVLGFSMVSCDDFLDNTAVKLKNLSGETLTVTELYLSYVDKVLWTGSEVIADNETKTISFYWEEEDWGHPNFKVIRQNGDIESVGGGLSLTISAGDKTQKLYIKWVDYVSWLRLGNSDEDAIRK